MNRRGYLLWVDGLTAIAIALVLAGVLFSAQPAKSPSALDAHYLASDVASVLSNAYEPQVAQWASGAGVLPLDTQVAGTLDSIAKRHAFACIQLSSLDGTLKWSSSQCASLGETLSSATVARGAFTPTGAVETVLVSASFRKPS